MPTTFWKENLKGGDDLENVCVDERIIFYLFIYNTRIDLKEITCRVVDWIQLAQDGVQWWVFCWEHSNKISGSVNGREFHDKLSYC
jgi:hypothetical protein